MPIILFDNPSRRSLLPFTYTKAVADLRFGILSVKERWALLSQQPVFVQTVKYLQPLYELATRGDHIWIDASVVPDSFLAEQILSLESGSCLTNEQGLIAGRMAIDPVSFDASRYAQFFLKIIDRPSVKRIEHPWQLMQWNDAMLRADFEWVTKGRTSQSIPSTVSVLQPENIFIEEGAKLNFCTLNASTGPVYLGKNTEIMEGSVIRGPFALGENSVIKMNSRIYSATSFGPSCMGGGEIKNTVMMGYSNKGHDGYLGDSVVGEWCNFGAGSTNSNIKNTAGVVKIWDINTNNYAEVGQKCGLIMGDYSRASINASINTGSMIGVCCNVYGAGLLPTIIPNFSWGVSGTKYVFEKALSDIDNWKKLKGHSLGLEETSVLTFIFDQNA